MEIVSLFFNLPSGHEFQGKTKLGKICESLLGKKRRSVFFPGKRSQHLKESRGLIQKAIITGSYLLVASPFCKLKLPVSHSLNEVTDSQ